MELFDDPQFNKNLRMLLEEKSQRPNNNAYEISINYIPEIIEEDLTWDQVIETKKDARTIKKLRHFRTFLNSNLKGKSKKEILDLLDSALEDYESALRAWGIHTAIGSISLAITSLPAAISALTEGGTSLLATGCLIAGGALELASNQVNKYFQMRNAPIAFIYDTVNKKLGKRDPRGS